ncbi:hypothetical protein [Pseudomonas aeruginosa]|nr:hypothetical protein [Pseudomonas aeruginosa]
MSFDEGDFLKKIQGFAEQGKERIALEKGREALERVGASLMIG